MFYQPMGSSTHCFSQTCTQFPEPAQTAQKTGFQERSRRLFPASGAKALTLGVIANPGSDSELLRSIMAQLAQSHWRIVSGESLMQTIPPTDDDSGDPTPEALPIGDDPAPYYDAVLFDLGLPDLGRLETFRQLMKAYPDLPVIVLTSQEEAEVGRQALREGAQDYLLKDSITAAQLVHSIQSAIERQTRLTHMQVQASHLLDALQQEQALNQLRSTYVAMVAHEFRNPLSVIRNTADLLGMTDIPLSEAKRQKYLTRIIGEVDHLLELTTDILLLGRVSQQGLPCQPQPILLPAFLMELVQRFPQDAEDAQPRIRWMIQGETIAWLDEDLLRPILTNLLSNAIRYSPRGGTVELEVISQAELVVLRVQDHGIGIPLAEQGNLFETFYRCQNTRGIAGHGLGLSIVKQCVDAHGGSISIDSREGVGTTVIVSFPQAGNHSLEAL